MRREKYGKEVRGKGEEKKRESVYGCVWKSNEKGEKYKGKDGMKGKGCMGG